MAKQWFSYKKILRPKIWFEYSLFQLVRVTGFEPASREASDPKSDASANSATPAYGYLRLNKKECQDKIKTATSVAV